MQRNFFWSSEQALPKLLVMLLVLSAPLQAQEFGAAVAIGDDEILIGEPLNQRLDRPRSTVTDSRLTDGSKPVR